MKKLLSDYIQNVLRNVGLFTLAESVFVALIGEKAKGITPLAALGSSGISVRLILQVLLVNLISVGLARLFLSSAVIKDMKPSRRMILATVSVFLTVLGCILVCGWIPLRESGGIIGFICFVATFFCAFLFCAHRFISREAAENRRLAEALDRYKSTLE